MIKFVAILALCAFTFPAHAEDGQTIRSIREFATCDGKTDDSSGVAKAFEAAKNGAFKLEVDAPVFIHIGMDVARPIFVDSKTEVNFSQGGLFIVDNATIPAFVIANSKEIKFTNWRVEYTGSYPTNWLTGGYYNNGVFVPSTGRIPASGTFNDVIYLQWLKANRGITFTGIKPFWPGPAGTAAIFLFTGTTQDVVIDNMKLFAAPGADLAHYIPICFDFALSYKDNQQVTKETVLTAANGAAPSNLKFTNIDLDGYIFGWLGCTQNTVFSNIRAHKYTDIQDADGQNVGGVGKLFPPPHLFYLTCDLAKPELYNKGIHISDVLDYGERQGQVRDKGGNDTLSGYALSLKIGANDSVVDHYKSYRPDGFLDVLPSNHLTISNVDATYNSAFMNNLFPGIRFPQKGYQAVTLENITLKDLAEHPKVPPIQPWTMLDLTSGHNTFKNVNVVLKDWSGTRDYHPIYMGIGNQIDVHYTLLNH